MAAVHERELKLANCNQATLAVARKLVAYLMAVDKSGKPFQASSCGTRIGRICRPDTPASIRRLLHRCLERDRRRRRRDIGDAFIEIDEGVGGESPAPAASPSVRRFFRWWNVGVTLLALAGFAVAARHFRETSPQPVPVRFQIPPPENANFGSYGMALWPVSPDD